MAKYRGTGVVEKIWDWTKAFPKTDPRSRWNTLVVRWDEQARKANPTINVVDSSGQIKVGDHVKISLGTMCPFRIP